MLVAGAGTGGTITGIARKLKERCPNVKVSLHLLIHPLLTYCLTWSICVSHMVCWSHLVLSHLVCVSPGSFSLRSWSHLVHPCVSPGLSPIFLFTWFCLTRSASPGLSLGPSVSHWLLSVCLTWSVSHLGHIQSVNGVHCFATVSGLNNISLKRCSTGLEIIIYNINSTRPY